MLRSRSEQVELLGSTGWHFQYSRTARFREGLLLVADKTIRDLIEKELQKDEPDWSLIENASRGQVDSDPNTVRFTVDAGHIQRLGAELVGKQDTALSELIKNALMPTRPP